MKQCKGKTEFAELRRTAQKVNKLNSNLVYKRPVDSQPELKTGQGIPRGNKVVISKPETTILQFSGGIQIFSPYKGLKGTDTEVHIGSNIGQRIFYRYRILVIKLPLYW